MFTPTQKILETIADEIDSGMICYVHKESGEIIGFPDSSQYGDLDEEAWGEDLEKINENPDDYFEFKPLESRRAYSIMERFTETIDHVVLKRVLERLLSNRNPFRNFKDEIDDSDYREAWFEFKKKEVIQHVSSRLQNLIEFDKSE